MNLPFGKDIGGGALAVVLIITMVMLLLALASFLLIRGLMGVLVAALFVCMLFMVLMGCARTSARC